MGKVKKSKVIVILGPTSSGKTRLAVKLARQFDGEIVSADSRQVYRGMDVGTGKDLGEYGRIKYHLLDVASPKKWFTVADYQKLAYKAINDILKRGKLPIVCGGTGLYIWAVVEGYEFQEVIKVGDHKVRLRLDRLSLKQLLSKLKKIDPRTYKVIDKNNRRRVQRALEIYYQTGKPKSEVVKKKKPPYEFLLLGINFPQPEIYKKIDNRLKHRLDKESMVAEIKRLHGQGVSWNRLEEFGLEYRWVSRYLRGKISYEEMVEELKKAIHHFAKRQMTWFKRNKKIFWIKNSKQTTEKVSRFLG